MEAVLTSCAFCGCAFRTTRGNRFCSRACACHSVNDRQRLAPRVCARCGRLFQPKRGARVYCSRKCAAAAGTERASALAAEARKAPAESRRFAKKCARCGVRFTTARISQTVCRPGCPGRRLCPTCGRPVRNRATVYCSRACGAAAVAERTAYIPTPKEIAEATASIRRGWPKGEAEKRLRPDWLAVPWLPPASSPVPIYSEATA